jgi:DNA-binding NarL/FixJ family response regulator
MKHAVSIVDADETFREACSLILTGLKKYYVSGKHKSGQEALRKMKRDKSELIIIRELSDVELLDYVDCVRAQNHLVKVLVVYKSLEKELVLPLFSAGASGIIEDNGSFNDVVHAADSILNGGAAMSSFVAKTIVSHFQKNEHSPLTSREQTVLQLQAKGKTYTEISFDLMISKETVKSHIKNIYTKLDVSSKSEAISKARTEKFINAY